MRKNQDTLLEEMTNNQLSKNSMDKIKGGSFPGWDSSWSTCTGSGELRNYALPNGVNVLYLNGKEIFPHELKREDRAAGSGC